MGAPEVDANHYVVVSVFDPNQITSKTNRSVPTPGLCHTLPATASAPIAFHGSQDPDPCGDITHPVGRNQGQETCVGIFSAGAGEKAGSIAYSKTNAPTLKASESGTNRSPSIHIGSAVRRLTPRECERLQGFPDDYTLITYRKKQAADGPRYKALGNSMAVPVMRWIGERIAMIEELAHAAA